MSNLVQPSTADFPSDPLLKPGAFIDANGPNQSPEPSKPPNGSTPNGAQPQTPAARTDGSTSSPSETKAKRRVIPAETWLPAGWTIEERVRSSGATAGTLDKYYVEPSSGRKFRSKKEVLYFLQTGNIPPKRKKETENAGGEETSTGKTAGNKQKKSDKKPKPVRLNFDFNNAPNKVDWSLTNASTDSWTPFLGDVRVAESTRQDWAAAFSSLTSSKSRHSMF